MITTVVPDFSFEVIFNQGSARQFDRIRCEAISFPAARVEWILTSEDYIDGRSVSNITTGQFNLMNSGSSEALTLTINGIINMTNLQYEDDGEFTCTVMNMFGSEDQSTRLRVKSVFGTFVPAV